MHEAEKQVNILWWRKNFLELTMISLRVFKQTKDPAFMDFAKYFGGLSKELSALK